VCLDRREEVGGGALCVRVWELSRLRRYSHAGGEGKKRKREAGGLSGGPQQREELLGRRRMGIGWEVCMRGLGDREGGGWLSVVAAPTMGGVEAIMGIAEVREGGL